MARVEKKSVYLFVVYAIVLVTLTRRLSMDMNRKQLTAYALASEEVGMREVKGPRHNPDIVQMFSDVGHAWVKDDETAWCAAFIGAMLERAGLTSTRKLNARSYLDWGQAVDLKDARPGDIVVFSRGDPKGWQGHVGFFIANAGINIKVLGGNQSDSVSVAHYSKSRLLGVRRTPAPSAAPASSLRPVARPTTDAPKGTAGWLTRLFSFLGRGG